MGLLVLPRQTELCHLLPFIITASSLFISLHQVIGLVSHEPQTSSWKRTVKDPRVQDCCRSPEQGRITHFSDLHVTRHSRILAWQLNPCVSRQRSRVVTLVQRFRVLSQHWIAWILVHGRRRWVVRATGKDIVWLVEADWWEVCVTRLWWSTLFSLRWLGIFQSYEAVGKSRFLPSSFWYSCASEEER